MKAVLLLLITLSSLCIQNSQTSYKQQYAFVTKMVDGDTLVINNQDKVRLTGINAPEYYQRCYNESTDKLKELVLNKRITLDKDISETDKYDRLLRYVFLGKEFVNLEMVKSGYAVAEEIKPNIKYSKEFQNAENFAKENKLGCLWS